MSKLLSSQKSVDWKQLLDKPRVYIDLNSGGKVDASYIAFLNSQATEADLKIYGLTLHEGMTVDLWTDDGDEDGNPDPLVFTGVVHFDNDLNQWVAMIPYDSFVHATDVGREQGTPALV